MNTFNRETAHHASIPLSPLSERVALAKSAYTTRRVDKGVVQTLLEHGVQPRSGDLLLARVEKIGHHKRLELEHGRLAPLFVGDEIIVCYGNRYAPDQFEAEVPEDLRECHLVAAGGIASLCLSRHGNSRAATVIQPVGLLADERGAVVNISAWALPALPLQRPRPFVAAVAGTSMNAGKTTSAAHLIRGMVHAGLKVGAAKITGTGAGGDRWLMKDAGAMEVVDFTDAGFASTYRATLADLEEIQERLIAHLRNSGAEAIVLEIADGLFQQETAALLQSPRFQANVDAILFAAGDAMGASGGVEWLRQRQLPVVAVSGCVSASPLAAREAAAVTGLPVLGLDDLCAPDIAVRLFESSGDWMSNTARAV